ncbi:MAG TPA: hypothetical protein DHW34_06000 [Actinobacteria bacterium]|nr:hypothetical protein [Actinomycetota bacterium]
MFAGHPGDDVVDSGHIRSFGSNRGGSNRGGSSRGGSSRGGSSRGGSSGVRGCQPKRPEM